MLARVRRMLGRVGVNIKRIYAAPEQEDGVRVLVDRLWPRGLKKSDAQIDLWLKSAAPSAQLRRTWHSDPEGHEPERFAAFARSYLDELGHGEASGAVDRLVEFAAAGQLTLLYGARDEHSNHAMVLCDEVRRRLTAKR